MRGGSIRRKRTTKVMKINGETFKITTPTTAFEVTSHHPNHSLYESQSLYQFGLRANPLEPHHQLKPKTLYFLLQLPSLPVDTRSLRRTRSDVRFSASDRLERLMLSRRSVSDLRTIDRSNPDRLSVRGDVKSTQVISASSRLENLLLSRRSVPDLRTIDRSNLDGLSIHGDVKSTQVKFRLPRAEFERLMKECKNKLEAVERIVDWCVRDHDVHGGA